MIVPAILLLCVVVLTAMQLLSWRAGTGLFPVAGPVLILLLASMLMPEGSAIRYATLGSSLLASLAAIVVRQRTLFPDA